MPYWLKLLAVHNLEVSPRDLSGTVHVQTGSAVQVKAHGIYTRVQLYVMYIKEGFC